MPRAIIEDGLWTRKVPTNWEQNGEWRTAIYKSVLSDRRLSLCRYVLEGGPTVLIPAEDLAKAVEGGPDYNDGRTWSPFNINPKARTVAGTMVRMTLE